MHTQRLSNGTIEQDSDTSTRFVELQETTEKQAGEIALTRSRISDLQTRLKDSEDSISSAKLEATKYQEQIAKLQRDLREVGVTMD